MNDDGMRGWRTAAITAVGVIVLAVPFYVVRVIQRDAEAGTELKSTLS